MDCIYIIKTKADITQAMLNVCIQNSVANLRTSLDGLECVLKWKGSDPPMFSGDTKYTHSEMLLEMAKPEWTSEEPI